MLKYDIGLIEADRGDPGKEKKMFTANLLSYSYQECQGATLDQKSERGLVCMHSDKSKLAGNTVIEDVGLSE